MRDVAEMPHRDAQEPLARLGDPVQDELGLGLRHGMGQGHRDPLSIAASCLAGDEAVPFSVNGDYVQRGDWTAAAGFPTQQARPGGARSLSRAATFTVSPTRV